MVEREPNAGQVRELLAQLTAGREAFRREVAAKAGETAKLDRRKKQIRRLHTAARAEKLRIRTLYKRFLRHMKRRWAAERLRVEADRAAVARDRAAIERTAAESRDYQQRLYASWELLQEGQRRLLADRQQAERWIAQQTDALDHRAATSAQNERQAASSRDELEAAAQVLRDEIAGLDTRAANARATVEQLELRQSRLIVPADGLGDAMAIRVVPFDRPATAPPSGDAEGLLVDLHARQQDLDRVRRKIFSARDELERQTVDLDDRRAILSEQVATLVAARELWNAAELVTLGEMEALAKSLRAKEREIEDRERQSHAAERLNAGRDAELTKIRERLEAWRKELAGEEAAYLAARDQHAAAMQDERKRLEWREESLEEVARAWGEIRDREREHFLGVLKHYESERAACAAANDDAERERRHCAAEIARVASLQLAIEEAAGDAGAVPGRKVRVLAARWEKQFKAWERRVEESRAKAERAAAESHDLRTALQSAMTAWLDGRTAAASIRRMQDRDQAAPKLLHASPEPLALNG